MKLGTLIVISSPSGGGKTTVIERLLLLTPHSIRFPTTTTRPPRPHEQAGVDYHFVTRSEFAYKIARGDFAEHVVYAGHYYGVDQKLLFSLLKKYKTVFVAIDVRGKQSLASLSIPQISIFLEPESLTMLAEHLNRRPGATAADTARRLAVAQEEISQAHTFTYRVVNVQGQLNETVETVKALLDNQPKIL